MWPKLLQAILAEVESNPQVQQELAKAAVNFLLASLQQHNSTTDQK